MEGQNDGQRCERIDAPVAPGGIARMGLARSRHLSRPLRLSLLLGRRRGDGELKKLGEGRRCNPPSQGRSRAQIYLAGFSQKGRNLGEF